MRGVVVVEYDKQARAGGRQQSQADVVSNLSGTAVVLAEGLEKTLAQPALLELDGPLVRSDDHTAT